MSDSAGVALATSWWARNGTEVQALSTVALIVITGIYMVITGLMLRAQRRSTEAAERQAAAAELEVAHLREALAVEQQHSDRIFEESLRARLGSATPVVIVTVEPARCYATGPDHPDGWTEDLFRQATIEVEVPMRIANEGPGPTIARMCPHRFDATEPADFVVHGGRVVQVEWRFRCTGSQWLDNWAGRDFEQFEIRTFSPLTGVEDRHTWTPRFVTPMDQVVHLELTQTIAPQYASQKRHWP